MLVFLSWSGEESRAVARTLYEWLPEILQAVTTWMAPEGIRPGEYFTEVITKKLEEADFGVICLNRHNFRRPWVLFEAGALAKATSRTRACPYLVGLNPEDLDQPLSSLQALRANREDTLRLVKEINSRLETPLDDKRLESSFCRCWDEIEKALQKLPKSKGAPYGRHVYYIFNRESGLCLEAGGVIREEGGQVAFKVFSGNDRQRWQLYETEDGFFTIVSQHVETCMDVDGGATDSEAKVHLWPFHGGSNQRWQFLPDKDGCFRLMRKNNRSFQLTASGDLLLQKASQEEAESQLWWLRAAIE